MEHPLVGDISSKTIDQLTTDISSLQARLNQAQRGGNGNLCQQIRMMIESYRAALKVKTDEHDQQLANSGELNFDKIKIE